MSKLTPFWRFIEARPGPLAVAKEWRDQLGPIYELMRPFLRPTDRRAKGYPHPDPRMPPLRVVCHRNGSVVAVDRDDPEIRIELTDTDLVLFEVNWRSLRAAIATALGLEVSRASATPENNVLHIGAWHPKPAATYPVVLVCCTDQAPQQKAVVELTLDADKPTMILTSTRGLWTGELEDYCRRRKCVLVPLDEVIEVNGASLVAGEAWRGFLEVFAIHGQIKLPANFSNRRPKRRRGEPAAKIEAIRNALVEHIRRARDHAFAAIGQGREPELLPRPLKKELAQLAGVSDYDVSRYLKDRQLARLWQIANSLEDVMKFG
ncbi:MAG: hypothetical protein IT442_06715 [Phycisphaeraceae bacterium]|nr:hypothetical protein [Phycisphaeraceae bacterium]